MKLADKITLSCVFNCYLRETGNYSISTEHHLFKLKDNEAVVSLPLQLSNKTLVAKVSHHTFYPILIGNLYEQETSTALSTTQAITLMVSELAKDLNLSSQTMPVLNRILESQHQLSIYLPGREYDKHSLFNKTVSFKESEQALITGHPVQPDPKSRVGFSDEDILVFAPEARGEFQLDYFLVAEDIVESESNLALNTDLLIRKLLVHDIYENSALASKIAAHLDYQLMPFHPWQTRYLTQQPRFQKLLDTKKVVPLGKLGPGFLATTSVRTVYSQDADFMFKFSLNVAITNSVRVNLHKELKRAVSCDKLMSGSLGQDMQHSFSDFTVIGDPAYIVLKDETGIFNETACIFRHNPFQTDNNVTPVASLCQENVWGGKNRIHELIEVVARNKGLSPSLAAMLWLDTFLEKAVLPILGLYDKYGLALEAHQQNLLVAINEGLVSHAYYRDSQGFYYLSKNNPLLFDTVSTELLADLCDCEQDFLIHHFCYYFIVNMLLGVLQSMSETKLLSKSLLSELTSDFLRKAQKSFSGHAPAFIDSILLNKTLPMKANLKTRLHGLDELQAPLTAQSIYVDIDNPFAEGMS